jgi:hypothetical protein
MTDTAETLTFACPHCGGPLHVVADGAGVECKHEHRFSVADVLVEQARTSSQATWEAVKALKQRAEAQRWAARDPELHGLRDSRQLEAAAVEDERAADLLRVQAQALDLTLWRISRAADDGVEASRAEG